MIFSGSLFDNSVTRLVRNVHSLLLDLLLEEKQISRQLQTPLFNGEEVKKCRAVFIFFGLWNAVPSTLNALRIDSVN